MNEINWRFAPFRHLSAADVYDALALRQRVFMLEQNIAVQDADGLDVHAWHLLGRDAGVLAAYARIFAPEEECAAARIGRVVVAEEARGRGLGRELMAHALGCAHELAPGASVKVAAQEYLTRFYEDLGFVAVSGVYDDHGVPHVDMMFSPLPEGEVESRGSATG